MAGTRLTLTVSHDGEIHLSVCPECTGEAEEAAEVLDRVADMLRRGVDDHGRSTTLRDTNFN